MSQQSKELSALDLVRQRCDESIDQSPTYLAYVQNLFAAALEFPLVDAVSLVDYSNPQEPKISIEENLNAVGLDGFFSLDLDHISLMAEPFRSRKTSIVVDRSLPEAGLKPHSIVMSPVIVDGAPPHLIELFSLTVPSENETSELRELIETLCSYLNRYLENSKGNQQAPVSDDEFWQRFDAYLLRLQKSLDLKQTISIAVNDGRSLIGADRVSIALKYGHQTRIYGISGQDGVQHRSNLVQSMASMAGQAIKIGQPITYQGNIDNIPPMLEQPLADYLTESRTRMVMLSPLHEPDPEVDPDENPSAKAEHDPKVIGCLIVEQATEVRPKKHVVQKTELLREHIEVAIHNCQRHETIFLLPLWRLLGRTVRSFKGKRLWIASALLAGIGVLSLLLAFVRWDYRVEGKGQAMPVHQHQVFAPWDGEVVEVLVESGEQVSARQPLLRLESDSLDAERIATKNERLEKEKLVAALTTQRAEAIRRDNAEELIRVSAELAKAVIEFEGASARLDKIHSRIDKLTVLAPEAGVVATFQIDLLLRNRPVSRGELLVEIMQPEGPWRLELEIPEYRMGHVMRSITSNESKMLPVEYIPATAVEKSFPATLSIDDIATRSGESEAEGTVIEVFADINKDDLPSQSLGAAVTAKINCGKRSLFYVLFGDVIEFLQRHLWF